MLCPRCGVDVGPTIAFCPKCSALESARQKEKPKPPEQPKPEPPPEEEKKVEEAEAKPAQPAAAEEQEAPVIEGRELFYSWSAVATALMASGCLAVVLCIIFALLTHMRTGDIVALSAFLTLGAAAVGSWFLVWLELVSENRALGIVSIFFPPLAYVMPFIYPTRSIKPVFVHCLIMLCWLWTILIFRSVSGQNVSHVLRVLLF